MTMTLEELQKIDPSIEFYRKKTVQPIRPYVPGEDLEGISVSPEDMPEFGGGIGYNPDNPQDRWYIGKAFMENYEIVNRDFDSTSDERVQSNVFRHRYRTLSGIEKQQMKYIKDAALALHTYLEAVGNSRELSLAKTKLEEAVMWAVKHITE